MVGSDVDKFCEDSCDGLRSHEAWGKCLRVLNGKSMRLRALELAASAETKDAQSRIPLLSRLFQIRRTVKHFILVSTASSSFLQHQLLQVRCVIWLMIYNLFLAVQNSSIGDLVPCLLAWLVGPAPLTIRVFTTLQSDPRDLWPLTHLIRVMMRHDLTKKDNDKYKDKDKDKDKYILREHSKSDLRYLWPLRHLIRVMRTHDLTKEERQ